MLCKEALNEKRNQTRVRIKNIKKFVFNNKKLPQKEPKTKILNNYKKSYKEASNEKILVIRAEYILAYARFF